MSKRSPHGHIPYYVLNYAQRLVRSDRPLGRVLARAYELGPQVLQVRPDIDHPGPAQYPCPVPLPASYLADDPGERDRTLWAGLLCINGLDLRAAEGQVLLSEDEWEVNVLQKQTTRILSKTYRSKGGRS
jgi:hypothetical protein